MDRGYYIEVARRGVRMPIGTDLVLHEHPDGAGVRACGRRLGEVIVAAARRYGTPLAIPLMDLTREKAALLSLLGVGADPDAYHLTEPPAEAAIARFERALAGGAGDVHPALRAHVESVRYVASGQADTGLLPVGMVIGPFSLMTKLLADPITPLFLAGSGATAADEAEVRLVEVALELATRLVLHAARQQVDAGARLMVVAEPAANQVYVSPAQMEAGSDVYDRYAMAPNRRLRALLADAGVDLFFHCCGEITVPMLRRFASLDPAVLSLGSSRRLWEDAALVPESTVLYGNLPSKQFYSDRLITADDVAARSRELVGRMRDVGHPFILGSECDVLHVPGCEHAIRAKVRAMLDAEA
jgi:uroporphyrinogen-III decarboxylase